MPPSKPEPDHNPGLKAMEQLRDRRIRAGVSQRSLAATAGVHQSILSGAENGNIELKISVIAQIAAGLGLRTILTFESPEPNTAPPDRL